MFNESSEIMEIINQSPDSIDLFNESTLPLCSLITKKTGIFVDDIINILLDEMNKNNKESYFTDICYCISSSETMFHFMKWVELREESEIRSKFLQIPTTNLLFQLFDKEKKEDVEEQILKDLNELLIPSSLTLKIERLVNSNDKLMNIIQNKLSEY